MDNDKQLCRYVCTSVYSRLQKGINSVGVGDNILSSKGQNPVLYKILDFLAYDVHFFKDLFSFLV